jgi:hypothetical protein
MLWFKRHYGLADYRQEFERFEEMFNSQHGPRDMMMVLAGLGDETTVYFYLPDPELAAAFPDFEAILPTGLPTEATLLVGHQDAFQERFKFARRD